MTDEMLLSFAEKENANITPEALVLLKAELAARNLEWDPFVSNSPEGINADDRIKHVPKEIWQYVMEQKEMESGNESILANLAERGIHEEEAGYIISHFSSHVDGLLHKAANTILTGTLLFVSGLAISFLPLKPGGHQPFIILSYSLMIVGALRIVNGLFYKNKYKKLQRK